jgi:hypothetical protein
MKEAVSGTVSIADVEEETFIVFCEFSYRGNYTIPYREDKEDNGYFNTESKYYFLCRTNNCLYLI